MLDRDPHFLEFWLAFIEWPCTALLVSVLGALDLNMRLGSAASFPRYSLLLLQFLVWNVEDQY